MGFSGDLLPTILFFVIFFIAFTLLELLVVFFLNRLGRRNWEFMIDVVIRSGVNHGRLIKWLVFLLLLLLIIAMLLTTPIFAVLERATFEFKVFAVVLALFMFLIYALNIQKTSRVKIEKKIYGTIFFVLSVSAYVVILILANETYESYRHFVNQQLIRPTVVEVSTALEDIKKEKLHQKFRKQYLAGECEPVDYTEEGVQEGELANFVLVAYDSDLSISDTEALPKEATAFLKGQACTDGEETFLITRDGRWYWVHDE